MRPRGVVRPLGAPELAFVRAWAEGLDPLAAWQRYLGGNGTTGPGDARRARTELQRLRDHLGALARAQGRPDLAALLRRDPRAIADDTGARPTLEAFAAAQPADFYSEAELVALYEAQHGGRGAARRRERLRARQLQALQWLERHAARLRAPRPDDALGDWLDERVAARLAAAGLRRLGDLMAWISRHGFRWHRGIPRLGPAGAARLLLWLGEHEATLGALPAPALQARRQLDTRRLAPPARCGMVPLERLHLPPGLDGRHGVNRAGALPCPLTADDDLAAIQAWLALREVGSHSWRAYRKEAERFLLWAVLWQRKALSSLDGRDCAAYQAFIAAPDPSWTGPRHAQRWTEAWRPFEGPLSARSQAAALSIVRSLCAWLTRQGYLAANPWDEAAGQGRAAQATATSATHGAEVTTAGAALRALSAAQSALLERWLAAQAQRDGSPAMARLQFLLLFTSHSGLRLSELAASRLDDLRGPATGQGSGAWTLQVRGRRAWREVPLPAAALQVLQGYLAARGLAAVVEGGVAGKLLPPAMAQAPLVGRLDGRPQALSAGRIYRVVVDGLERCAAQGGSRAGSARGAGAGAGQWATDEAERLPRASPHWLRHTCGARLARQGLPAPELGRRLGHASRAATAVYLREADRRGRGTGTLAPA